MVRLYISFEIFPKQLVRPCGSAIMQAMYLDRDYRPRRRRQGFFGRFWPLLLLVVVGIVLYETQPTWLVARPIEPTPTPTRSAVSFQAEAESALMRGDYSAALDAYEKMVQLEPNNPDPLVVKSRLYMIEGDVAAAHEVAVRAVELAPENPQALTVLARAEDWLGNYEEAVRHALDAYDLNADNAETLAVLSEIYADIGNFSQSQSYIDEALAIAPDDVLALRNQAYLFEKLGKYNEAIASLDRALAQAPQRADLYLEKARIYRVGLADYDNAILAYRAAVDANKTAVTLDALGEGLYNAGDHLAAIRMLNDALEMNPDYGPALVHLGMALYARRNYEDAATAFDKGLPLIGDSAREEHYYTAGLAHVYKEPRECTEARPWLDKALEKNPESGPALTGQKICASSATTSASP
ncbi:MAG: tetratricopeptide repeat protein [Caldilinea sp.]|nr:tetratricopeptide repeat protein [Caldilinea sp.]MCB0048642.1 tetratricopeptide repeat protein [Caldilinea sp.]MCB0146265.1 tetratricopeptide repeat protein [Caldilineaceae bacterium]